MLRPSDPRAPHTMPKKKTWREPELPWSLQDEINPDRVRDAKPQRKQGTGPNRKQLRKDARQQKKVRPRPPGRPKPEPEPEPEPEPPRKEKKCAAVPAPAPAPAAKKKKAKHTPTAFEELLRERGVLRSTEGRGAGSMDAIDDHIDELERKLGLKKGSKAKAAKKRLDRELAEDGLSGWGEGLDAPASGHGEAETGGPREAEGSGEESMDEFGLEGEDEGEEYSDEEEGEEEEGEEEDDDF